MNGRLSNVIICVNLIVYLLMVWFESDHNCNWVNGMRNDILLSISYNIS